MTRTIRALSVLVAAGLLLAACTVKKQETPPLAGPSVLATSLTLSANPDILRQDGSSQSTIVVVALDANGQPVKSLPVRVDIAINGVVADFGQVSSRNVVTSNDGRASLLYTAPNAPVDPVDGGVVVDIQATPTGTNYANAVTRVVSIRLVPPGVILPPNGTPIPRFTFSPSAPLAKTDVIFDGSLSTDSDGQIVSYAWRFGDGTTGSGVNTRHQYQAGGSYTVALTVTDNRGFSASTTQAVQVTDSANPTADFVFSPTSPRPNDDIIFNASASRAAQGRSIVSYEWDFGTGRTGSGITVTKAYSTPATYNVTLVVTDNVGNKGTTTKPVTVQAAPLVASFVFSPSAPAPRQNVAFDAGASTAGVGRTIVAYDWNFGDTVFNSGKVVNHMFRNEGSYTVQLTIRDDLGQTATTTKTVAVASGAIVAGFSYSPTNPSNGQAVFFNGSDSTSPFGIGTWDWNFGDGYGDRGIDVVHAFSCGGSVADRKFVVRLTVSDGMGRTATTTREVTVKCS
ncbi:MAG: PKD domain-containing protein [Vicinamibacterales bacterium]|nr:PKD domain-containing protein [Vicinamibacterales bacterium]